MQGLGFKFMDFSNFQNFKFLNVIFKDFGMFRRVWNWLEGYRQVLEAYIDLLNEPFKPAGGLCPPDSPIFLRHLFYFLRNGFFGSRKR